MNFAFLAGLFLLFHTISAMTTTSPPSRGPGSTPNIQQIVKGRCHEYQKGLPYQVRKDCDTIWQLFYKAFAYKDLCKLEFANYQPFFDEVGMEEITKSMYWSSTNKEAHIYADSGARFTTLEDTFVGYLVNGLNWCGKLDKSSDGIDYTSCPTRSEMCDTSAFWGLASKTFAEHANGVVHVMLSGSRIRNGKFAPAYDPNSFFGKFELPNFKAHKITEIVILLVHSIKEPNTGEEHCGAGSLEYLQEKDAKQFKTTCVEDPDVVRHILCVDHPKVPECHFMMEKMLRPPKSMLRD